MTLHTPVREQPRPEARSTSEAAPARWWTASARHDPLWTASALVAAALMALAAFLPLWRLELVAPQYPRGLEMTAYGWRMTGDLQEINTLNHYVGMAPIHQDDLLELKAFPFLAAGIVLVLVAAAFLARHRWQRWLLAGATFAFPLGMLADLQFWLHRYGQDLDPTAPFRLDPFTPKVLGTTQVMNFHTETMVAVGFWVMVLAGLVLLAGPAVVRFVRDSWQNTGTAAAAAILVPVLGALLIAGAALAAQPPTEAHAASAPGASIAGMVAEAPAGGTVVVPAGVYVEQVLIDKPLTLVGEPGAVIDGGGLGDVVHIAAEDVTVRGFVIRNTARVASVEPSGIRVTADRATIEGNELVDVLYGIALQSSNDHVVQDNTVTSIRDLPPERRGHVLYIWYSERNLVQRNLLQLGKDGIFLGFATDVRVVDNVVTGLRYGVHTMYARDLELRGNVFRDNVAGASLMYSTDLLVVDNEFSHNRSRASGYGLLFKDMDNVDLVGNRITHNRLGLQMDGAPRTPGAHVTLRGNLIAYNQVAAELFRTVDATFTENTFIGNLQQIESRGGSLVDRNTWHVGGRGNYWDDYQGFDADGDGLGDVPYRYEGVYDDLLRKDEALRAYAFTPARAALDLAARWFPVYRLEPRVVDEHPLTNPTISLDAGRSGPDAASAAANLALVGVALLAFHLPNRTQGRPWR